MAIGGGGDRTNCYYTNPSKLCLPAPARLIHTPLVKPEWAQALQTYPLKSLAELFPFRHYFRLPHWIQPPGRPLGSAHKNLEGALLHPEIVEDYFKTEVANHRVAGPYNKKSCPNAHISRFGVIPKCNQQGKWRLIVDLSYPKHHSVNDGIPKHLCSLTYVTVDDAIAKTP